MENKTKLIYIIVLSVLFSSAKTFAQSLTVDFSNPAYFSDYAYIENSSFPQFIGRYIGPYSNPLGQTWAAGDSYFCYPPRPGGGTNCNGIQGAFVDNMRLVNSTSYSEFTMSLAVPYYPFSAFGGGFRMSVTCGYVSCNSSCTVEGVTRAPLSNDIFFMPASTANAVVRCPATINRVEYRSLEAWNAVVKSITLGVSRPNLDLSVVQDLTAFSASPSQRSNNGKYFSVAPGVSTSIKVKVSGSNFNTSETRMANVSLKIGNNVPMTAQVPVADIKAAGTLEVPFSYTFRTDEAGEINLTATIDSADDSQFSNNSVTDKTYVLCNVENIIQKAVPFFFQGQIIVNNPASSWGNDGLNSNPNELMKEFGCMVSDLAMLYGAYGISAPDGSKHTPKTVNIGLSQSSFYSQLGPNYSKYNGFTPAGRVQENGAVAYGRTSFYRNCLRTRSVDTCLAESKSSISYKGSNYGAYDQNMEKGINKELCVGNPIILKVPSLSNPNDPSKAHYVLAKSAMVNDDGLVEYAANNPGRKIGVDNLYSGQGKVKGYKTYRPTDDPSMLFIHLTGATDMIITDPTGRRSGYDPFTQTIYDEIPGGKYYVAESISSPDDAAKFSAPETRFEGLEPVDGRYQVLVISKVSTNYRMTAYSFDGAGTINGINDESGNLHADGATQLQIDHSPVTVPVRYSALEIKRALFFDSIRKDRAFVEGRITPIDGRSISQIKKYITVNIGPFSKTILIKSLRKIEVLGRTYYFYAGWGKNDMAIEINADTGQFALYFDNLDLDDSKPSLTTTINIQIDDINAQGLISFKGITKRSKR